MTTMFFTRIKEPKEFRKNLLLSSKDLIQVMKGYHIIQRTKKQKQEKIDEVRSHFNELNQLLEKLDAYLPEESMKQLEELLPKHEVEEESVFQIESEDSDDESEDIDEDQDNMEDSEPGKKGRKRRKKSKAKKRPKTEDEKEIDKLQQALDNIEKKLQNF